MSNHSWRTDTKPRRITVDLVLACAVGLLGALLMLSAVLTSIEAGTFAAGDEDGYRGTACLALSAAMFAHYRLDRLKRRIVQLEEDQ